MYYKYLTLSALLALIALATAKVTSANINRRLLDSRRNPAKIVTRQNVSIEEVPYQIAIELFTFLHYGGSLISEDYVLTAAQCFQFPSSWYTIRAGSSYYQSAGSTHLIAETFLHEAYSVNENLVTTNDIALVRVNTPFRFGQTRQPVPLYNDGETVNPGDISTITGYGVTAVSNNLQIVNVQIVSREACDNAHIDSGGISEGQICAAYTEGSADPCITEPGAPLVISGRLAGLYSWGDACAPEAPGVYTEVASYRDWIRERIGF